MRAGLLPRPPVRLDKEQSGRLAKGRSRPAPAARGRRGRRAGAMTGTTRTDAAPRAVPLRTIALLALAAFSSSVNIRASDPLLPQIADSFTVSVGTAAGIVTAFTIGYGLTQLLFGPVGDRLGKYLVAAVTCIAAGVATALGARVAGFEGLLATRFAAGALAAATIPLAFAWIGDTVPFERRQGVLARFLSAQMTGIVLGQAAGGLIGDHFGWRTVYLIIGALHVVAGLAMLVELRANPAAQPPKAPAVQGFAGFLGGLGAILGRRWVRIMLLAVFAESFAMYGAFAYIGADLRHRFGLSFSMIGIVMSVYGGGAILYSLTARRMLARLGERGFVLSGGVLLAAGFTGLALARDVWLVPPLMALLGLAFYLIHNTLQTNATQMAPEARGLGVSLFAFALFLGQSIGVAIAAPVMDRYGAPPIFFAAAFMLPLVALWFRAMLAHRPAN